MRYSADQSFSARFEFAQLGALGVARFEGPNFRYSRLPKHIAKDSRGDFYVSFNDGGTPWSFHQRAAAVDVAPGLAIIGTSAEACEFIAPQKHAWYGLNIERRRMLEAVAHAEDLLAHPQVPDNAAARHLYRYLGILLQPETGEDAGLTEHVEATLIDLVVLMLGAQGDAAELAKARGLRAVRLRELLALIRAEFADPGFSSQRAAERLGLSQRYVNRLLFESEQTFAERVLELRLQKAKTTLMDPRSDRLKVSEIAYSCGFNEVSYFNRRFRARFGCSPTQYRSGKGNEAK